MPISLNHRAPHHHPCRPASVDGACVFAAAIGSIDAADREWGLGKLPQTITNFTSNSVGNPAGNFSYAANATVSLTAVGGASGNPIVFSSSTPSICTISTTNANQANLISIGTCTLTANQSGNASYDPAPTNTLSLIIGKGAQVISNFNPPGQRTSTIGDTLTLTATGGGSANPVSFTAIPATVCTLGSGINSNQLTVVSLSTCTVTANQAGNTNYDPATAVSVTISFVAASAQIYYIHPDHLGTPRVITKATDNTKVWEWKNEDAFGNNPPDENPSGVNGSTPFIYNLRLPGQYFDVETGTHYNYFRDYDPSTGRYVQSDPIGLRAGLNTFAYVHNAPLQLIDPYGLEVQVCSQPAFGWMPMSHEWIKTSTVEAGMGGIRGNEPGNQSGDKPGDRVQVTDHSGRSKQKGVTCEVIKDVDEKKVNEQLIIGRDLGRWGPTNQCQSFVAKVLGPPPDAVDKPYIGYPGFQRLQGKKK